MLFHWLSHIMSHYVITHGWCMREFLERFNFYLSFYILDVLNQTVIPFTPVMSLVGYLPSHIERVLVIVYYLLTGF